MALVVECRAGHGGERTATILQRSNSGSDGSASKSSQIRVRREKTRRIAPWTWIVLAFLPEGYPSSVSSDYLAFQTWDTLQGLSTYIRSMLSTQALLSGIGVGAATATAIGATFQWFLRDLTGMVGGIVFTLYQGSNLDNRAKQWRLAADFMNDIGMLMDLVSPLFPRAFMFFLCLGSAARAVTGVAGGATRAALTQHFARKQNAADVSAKEGSQETAATLVGMIVGMFLARLTANNIFLMWTSFMSLTAFHMYANYKAVCALCLTSINAERMAIVLQSFLKDGKAPSPEEASAQESALPRPFTSRSGIIFGAKISSLCGDGRWEACSSAIERYGTGKYLLVCQRNSIQVVLHHTATSKDYLRAYTHALLLKHKSADEDLCSKWMGENFNKLYAMMQECGWKVDHVLISPLEWRAEWLSKQE
ncbi:protein root UVB sensitive 3 [Selaginella moellendorffii]|uniref:protein root UVB sensitive 3 n=1 Tax=Selaginella moellendorffii TaxID=88036 RepID=UPI000D1C65DC|nr:protein root UVB sensitive 3 [Selaginella moellendorffii]|eukprot:XP_024534009.1 protein root UVB sensitive 3 [Selaginella moellendorffii]